MNDFEQHLAFVEAEVVGSERIETQFVPVGDERIFVAKSAFANNPKALVIWIHGTPGSWNEAGRYMLADSNINWVSIDRPGWGESRRALNNDEKSWQQHRNHYASFDLQSKIIKPLVQKLVANAQEQKIILAGFSWGAPLAAQLALEIDEIDGLVLFAGGFSPELMSVRWYHRLAGSKLGKWLVGEDLDRANEEMLALPASLDALLADWRASERTIPTYVIQGGKDPLVPAANASWLMRELPHQPIEVFVDPDYGHFWHIQRHQDVLACVAAMIEDSPSRCGDAVATFHQ